jgi:hypothetical protein
MQDESSPRIGSAETARYMLRVRGGGGANSVKKLRTAGIDVYARGIQLKSAMFWKPNVWRRRQSFSQFYKRNRNAENLSTVTDVGHPPARSWPGL